MNEQHEELQEADIRTGVRAGDDGQMGSGGATSGGGGLGSGGAFNGQLGTGS